jgi:8-hydroxy-5-deazaflavin:NADPH oxidoreductase
MEGNAMKVGIIGSGHIGGAAAKLFTTAGHQVALSHAHGPDSLRETVARLGPNACAMTVEEAAAFGDVVLLAIPYGDYRTIPAKSLVGKIVVDAMNYYPQRDGQIDFQGLTSTELLARHLPGARLVKAFNTMHAETLGTDGRPGSPEPERLVLCVAGDDASAKEAVSRLIREIGFAPVDTGTLREGGRKQEPGSAVYGQPMKPAEAKKALSGVA